ncbi:MAG: GNAT family N-acetyltransferase, partial [Mycobacteriales bacterium]
VLVGAVILNPFPDIEPTEVEVGWHLGRAYWGNGYATEAGAAALDHGFQTVGLDRIFAVVYSENARSLAVCDRLGMTHHGSTDRYYGVDLELFTIDRAS